MRQDREYAIDWARKLMVRDDWCVLDTETTGLEYTAEACQIAVVAPSGQVLLDTLVKPTIPIPLAAQRIHHITDAMVETAPRFHDLVPTLRDLLSGLTVVIYNAAYDERVIEQSAQACGLAIDVPIFGAAEYVCAMERYAAYFGAWSDWHQSYTYQRLPGGDHTAKGDALATLQLIKRMAGHVDIGAAKEQVAP